jgi:hypothetical protein
MNNPSPIPKHHGIPSAGCTARMASRKLSGDFPNGELPDQIEVALRKTVVRATPARIAALCDERCPDSVSPHGGQGYVAIAVDPSKLIRATFVNTPETMNLDLASVSSEVITGVGLSHVKSPD